MDYSRMEFAPYQFREYPKYIKVNGKSVVVNDSQEEREMLAQQPTQEENDVGVESDERRELQEECERLGVKYNKRWGVLKLKEAISGGNPECAETES